MLPYMLLFVWYGIGWTLFFTFNMTQARLQESNEDKKTSMTSGAVISMGSSQPLQPGSAQSSFFIRNKRYISGISLPLFVRK
jgi:hypothetical protein